MNTENSEKNKFNKFIYQFNNKLNLKTPDKNIGLVNLSIYCTQKNIEPEYNNNFKISAPTWNDAFDLTGGSYSKIQDYFEFIIKNHEALAENTPIQIYSNRIKNRIVFKGQTGYKLELLSPETMKLFGSTKKMLIKINKGKMCLN